MKAKRIALYSVLGVIGLIILLGIIGSATSERVIKGNSGILEAGTQGVVLVATNKGNLEQIVRLSGVRDTTGVTQMVLAGQAFFVDRGTRVLVIDTTFSDSNVRILDGESAGRSGWVPEEFVKKDE